MDIYKLIENNEVESHLNTMSDVHGIAEFCRIAASMYCRGFANIEKSNQYYQKALGIYEEINDIHKIIDITRDLAVNKELVGDYEDAYKGFRRCADLSMSNNYIEGFMLACGGIAVLYLHLKDINNPRVKEITSDCQLLYEKTKHPFLSEALVLIEALEGNASDRLRDKIHAQDLLENLIANTNYPPNKWSGTRFLLINYLDEMILTKSTNLLEKSKSLFNTLRPSTKNNFILKIRLTILETKLSMISGDLSQSKKNLESVLNELERITKSRVIKRFTEEVAYELDLIKFEYAGWRELMKKNISLKDESKKDELLNYIIMAKNSIQSMSSV